MGEAWQADLERWLAPYLEGLGNKTRRRMCPAYIAGLIGPGDRGCGMCRTSNPKPPTAYSKM